MCSSYQTTTITELMSELDTLGGSSRVMMDSSRLIGVGGSAKVRLLQAEGKEYLLWENNKKKYYYHHVNKRLEKDMLQEPLEHFQQGFNVTLLVYGHLLKQILGLVYRQNRFAMNHFVFPLDPKKAVQSLVQAQTSSKIPFYQWDQHLKVQQCPRDVTLTKIIDKQESNSELRIICLPGHLFLENPCKSQLLQVLDCLKTHPQKSGKQVSNSLFMKKHKILSMFLENVFEDNLNYCVHDYSDSSEAVFQFFNKFRGLSNFSMKGQSLEQTIVKAPLKQSQSRTREASRQELQYCRQLERKTHKFSVTHQLEQSQVLEETSIGSKVRTLLSHEQELQVLKSEHLVQISKYHQTIQCLNAKLLVLQNGHSVQQLCSLYQKEIMLLELKIKDLRLDVSNVCEGNPNELRRVINKLNQELLQKETAKSQPRLGISGGKLKQVEQRLIESQAARQLLVDELKTNTNRLSIREQQVRQLNDKISQMVAQYERCPVVSGLEVSVQRQLSDLNHLLNQLAKGNGEAYIYVKRRVSMLFQDMSLLKELVMQCSQFLVGLQTQLEERVQKTDPMAVLDCNRFIRSFLLKCIDVKQ